MNSTNPQSTISETEEGIVKKTETDNIQRPKYDVFISYSSMNKNIADAICANFEQNGIKCWYAPRDIMPGKSWPSAIKAGIRESSVFILVFSENSNESKQVTNEVSMAYTAEKTIIPFKISETQMNDDLEYFLNRVHWLDAVSEPLEKKIDELRKYAERVLEHFNDKETPAAVHPPIMGYDTNTSQENPAPQTDIATGNSNDTKTEPSKLPASQPEISSEYKTDIVQKKDIKKLLFGGIFAAVAVILLLCIGLFSGSSSDKLMEDALALYHSQYHSTKDNNAARELFMEAAEKGEADAYYYLGKLDERIYDYDGAMKNYELGVEADSDLARLGLGGLRLEGWDKGELTWEEARTLFETALNNGCIEANYYMGRLAADGLADVGLNGDTALEYYKKTLDGDPEIASEALFWLGELYILGTAGIEKDFDKAIEYYEEAGEIYPYNEGRSQQAIGRTYEKKDELKEASDYFDLAFKFYSAAASAGDIYSMNRLGVIYSYKNFNDYNISESIRWYTSAADAGHPIAKSNLGVLYADGRIGGKNDYERAAKYYKESAKDGYTTAKYKLALLYYNGKLNENGTADEENYKEAEKWFLDAAEDGHNASMNYLGIIYYNGYLGEKDYTEALKWYTLAANTDNHAAEFNLGLLYENKNFEGLDYNEAAIWYEKAANSGDGKAAYYLGNLYYNGKLNESGERDYEQAAIWYEKGADAGNSNAMYWLGNIYYYGNLGEPDYKKAEKYYKQAIEAGNSEPMTTLGNIYHNGYLGEKDYTEALKWYKAAIEKGDTIAMGNAGLTYQKMEDYDNALAYYGMAIDNGHNDPESIRGFIQKLVDNGHVTAESAAKWLNP